MTKIKVTRGEFIPIGLFFEACINAGGEEYNSGMIETNPLDALNKAIEKYNQKYNSSNEFFCDENDEYTLAILDMYYSKKA